LLVIIFLSLIAGSQLPKLTFDVSTANKLVVDDDDLAFYRKTVDTFGADSVIITYFEDPALNTPDRLLALKQVLEAIGSDSSVQKIDSLFSLPHLRSIDGEVKAAPYLQQVPSTAKEVQALLAQALRNPFASNNLLAASGTAMIAVVYLQPQLTDAELDSVSAHIDSVLGQLNTFEHAFQLSTPFINQAVEERIDQDVRTTLPIAFGILLMALALALRRPSGMLVPAATASLSVVWTLGAMAALDIPVNVLTSIVPALLIIIGSTEDIHLLTEYQAQRNQGHAKATALHQMAQNMGGIIALTFFTTYLGFLSITLNDIELLSQFGLVASSGLLVNYLITITLVPAMLNLFGGKGATRTGTKMTTGGSLADGIFRLVSRNRRSALLIVLLATALLGSGIALLKADNTTLGYFEENSELNQRVQAIQSQLAGTESLSIVFEAGIRDTFLQLQYLGEIQKLQRYLVDSGFADSTLSFVDYLALLHSAMEENDSGDLYLPEDDAIVREYMLFINPDQVRGFLSPENDLARINVRHRIASSHELSLWLAKIRVYINEHIDPDIRVRITGESVLAARAAGYMIDAQIQSLGLMILVIFTITSVLFFSPKAGMIAVLPNLLPILILFGTMGYLGLPLNTGTAMTASIALGICVDDTMHFMMRYSQLARRVSDKNEVLRQTVLHEATPIFTTSIALALGFAVLASSSFPPIAHFGLLSAFVILLAVLATFVVTPALLSFVSLVTLWDVLSLKLKREVVEESQLFRGLSKLQVRKAVLLGRISEHDAGETVFRQGDIGSEMCVVLDGDAVVTKHHPDGSHNVLDQVRIGDVIGEIALVSHQPRMANIVTRAPTTLLSFDQSAMERVSRLYPRIAARMLGNIASVLGARMTRLTNLDPMMIDDTSGALKKTVFALLLEKERQNARRYSHPLAAILIRVPDTASLPVNPVVAISHEIQSLTRSVDPICRWDASTLVLLLPQTSQTAAEAVLQKLLTNLVSLTPDVQAQTLAMTVEHSVETLFEEITIALDKTA
jgi:predicted RND superfamily exporter protein/CRP-like cAMP-binding protein